MPDPPSDSGSVDVFVVAVGDEARVPSHVLARDLRHSGLSVLVDYESRSLRAQMKRADRARVAHVLIVGDDELKQGEVTVKDMATGEQSAMPRDGLATHLLSRAEQTADH